MSMGKGAVLSFSSKQKINTKSSTEAEIVAVDDAMNLMMWSKNFFLHQMKNVPNTPTNAMHKRLGKHNMLQQDNTSAIQLERNGKRSCSKRTRHIDIRYFYVTDRLENGDLDITYCPTTKMTADYMSKPLQGSLFEKHRNAIMGLSDLTVKTHCANYYEAKQQQES